MAEQESLERSPSNIDYDSPDLDKTGTEWQLVDDSVISQCGSSPRSVSQIESNAELEELLNMAREEESVFQSTHSNVRGSEPAKPDSEHDNIDAASDSETDPASSQVGERLPTSMMNEPSPLTSSTSEVLSLTESLHSDDSAFGVYSSQSEISTDASIGNLSANQASFVCLPDHDSESQEDLRNSTDVSPEGMHEDTLDTVMVPEEMHEDTLKSPEQTHEEALLGKWQVTDSLEESVEFKHSAPSTQAGENKNPSETSEVDETPVDEVEEPCKKVGLSSLSPKQPAKNSPWDKKSAEYTPATKPTGFTAMLNRLWSEIKERLGLTGYMIPQEVRSKFMRLAQKRLGGLGSPTAVNLYLVGGIVSLGAMLLWSWARNRSLNNQLLQSQMDLHHHFTTIVNLNEQLSRGLSQPVLQHCGYTSHSRLLSGQRPVFSLSSGVF